MALFSRWPKIPLRIVSVCLFSFRYRDRYRPVPHSSSPLCVLGASARVNSSPHSRAPCAFCGQSPFLSCRSTVSVHPLLPMRTPSLHLTYSIGDYALDKGYVGSLCGPMVWANVLKRARKKTLSGFGVYPIKKLRGCMFCALSISPIIPLWMWKGKGIAMEEVAIFILIPFATGCVLFIAVFLWNLVRAPFEILNEKIEAIEHIGQPAAPSMEDQTRQREDKITKDMVRLSSLADQDEYVARNEPFDYADHHNRIIELTTEYSMWFPDKMQIDKIGYRAREVRRVIHKHGYAKANEILLESAKDWGENENV